MNAIAAIQEEKNQHAKDLPTQFLASFQELVRTIIKDSPVEFVVKYVTFAIQHHEDGDYSVELVGVYDQHGAEINERSIECFYHFEDYLFDMMWDLIAADTNAADCEWQIRL